MPPGGPSAGPVAAAALIDTHVHFHDCFTPAAFLEAAHANLEAAARELGLDRAERLPARVLLAMETGGPGLIDRLREGSEEGTLGGWTPASEGEAGSLTLEHSERPPLVVVEGRQIVTAERLEVLAAPCPDELSDGLPLESTLAAVEQRGAVPILPWGVGKWSGRRGRVVSALLESASPGRLILADNGGRLASSWKPRLLTLGAQRGFPVVRGSDPLPRASEVDRVGSSGSIFYGAFDRRRPASAVRRLLADLRESPRSFGHGVGPFVFVTNQLHMQLRRRRR